MKLQEVMDRFQLTIRQTCTGKAVIRFCGGEWDIPGGEASYDDALLCFIKQLKDAAWTEWKYTNPVDALVAIGIDPEYAEGEWFCRNALSRSLLIFFGVEIYEALLSTEEVLSCS